LPHKNHRYLLDVIKILNYDLKIDMSLVLCGSDKGYLDRLKKHALKLKIDTKVIFLNFVDNDHLPYLYLNAFALAMPTYSGPTNIPPWEAFHLGTPVLYSDIFEIKKIYKDAVYYVDPYDPLTMVEGIKKMLQNDLISQELIHNGKKLLNSIDNDKEFGQFFDIIRKRKKLKESWVFEK
jgi:glycosyltransferase involved in cell wall biosynthesis